MFEFRFLALDFDAAYIYSYIYIYFLLISARTYCFWLGLRTVGQILKIACLLIDKNITCCFSTIYFSIVNVCHLISSYVD